MKSDWCIGDPKKIKQQESIYFRWCKMVLSSFIVYSTDIKWFWVLILYILFGGLQKGLRKLQCLHFLQVGPSWSTRMAEGSERRPRRCRSQCTQTSFCNKQQGDLHHRKAWVDGKWFLKLCRLRPLPSVAKLQLSPEYLLLT